MRKIKCPYCGFDCIKYGKTRIGSQRWRCRECHQVFTKPYDHTNSDFRLFLQWLFSKNVQKDMPGAGRNFRRKTVKFWELWPLPPKVETQRSIVFIDGIHLGRKACILICCDEKHVLGWYVCRAERAQAWEALMNRIATPKVVVSDGGTGFRKALKKVWPKAKLQRCIFHASQQVKRYTTTRPKTLAGAELYGLSNDLFKVNSTDAALNWVRRLTDWKIKHKAFLDEVSYDEYGKPRLKHERLLKAEQSLIVLIKSGTLFTYLDRTLDFDCSSTNNRIEGGINAQLRAMLRYHRGMNIERRIKAVFWWCYMHSPKPLSPAEILEVMPTNKSISQLYDTMNSRERLENSIPTWGDAIVWSDFHFSDPYPNYLWD